MPFNFSSSLFSSFAILCASGVFPYNWKDTKFKNHGIVYIVDTSYVFSTSNQRRYNVVCQLGDYISKERRKKWLKLNLTLSKKMFKENMTSPSGFGDSYRFCRYFPIIDFLEFFLNILIINHSIKKS